MTAHEYEFIDDDAFVCKNCGVSATFDDAQKGGICSPCYVCNNVHICSKIGATPWSDGSSCCCESEDNWLGNK